MDIKWKNIARDIKLKVAIFIIIVLCFSISLDVFRTIMSVRERQDYNMDAAFFNQYSDTNAPAYLMGKRARTIINLYNTDENHTKQYIYNNSRLNSDIVFYIEFKNSNIITNIKSKDDKIMAAEAEKLINSRDYNFIYKNLPKEASEQNSKLNKEKELSSLEPNEKISTYYANDGSIKTTSLKIGGKNSDEYHTLHNISKIKDVKYIFVSLSDEKITIEENNWAISKDFFDKNIGKLKILIGISLVLFIYLVIVIGKKQKDSTIYRGFFDRFFSEIHILIILALLYILGYIAIINIHEIAELNNIYERSDTSWVLMKYLMCFIFALGLYTTLSLIRKIKAGKLIKESLTFIGIKYLFRAIKKILGFVVFPFKLFNSSMYAKGSETRKLFITQRRYIISSIVIVGIYIISVMSGSISGLVPFSLFVIEIAITIVYIMGNKKTYLKIDEGFDENIKEMLKSERMKTELVTNVSHDLKTPLTSIISYVELLKKLELTEEAKEYVEILDKKSNSLKNMLSDLFDLSRSASGNLNINLEVIDFNKLIEQTIADMDDKISKYEANIKKVLPENPVIIKSDGNKLYRVLQNLIDNAIKYSMKNSRIFIELKTVNNKAVCEIKNISSYEIDFTSDEILSRFVRGDKSRSEEGSGLGLSIAQGFTQNCGGEFKLDIDGDMFKITLKFDLLK